MKLKHKFIDRKLTERDPKPNYTEVRISQSLLNLIKVDRNLTGNWNDWKRNDRDKICLFWCWNFSRGLDVGWRTSTTYWGLFSNSMIYTRCILWRAFEIFGLSGRYENIWPKLYWTLGLHLVHSWFCFIIHNHTIRIGYNGYLGGRNSQKDYRIIPILLMNYDLSMNRMYAQSFNLLDY